MTDNYPEAGRYGCVATPGFGPWLIRVGTRSWANHVFITIDDHGTVIEAEPGGVRKANIGEYHGDRLMLNLHEPCTAQQRATIAETAAGLIGVPYDDMAIVDDGLEAIGVRLRWLAKMANAKHEIICSQLVSYCGNAAGMDWSCGKASYSEVTPGDLARRTGYMAAWAW